MWRAISTDTAHRARPTDTQLMRLGGGVMPIKKAMRARTRKRVLITMDP